MPAGDYLAAWGWALRRPNGDDQKAQDFVAKLYRNVPVLDTGADGSTTTFVQRGIGDVLLAWENRAFLALEELGPGPVRDRRALAQHPRRTAGHPGRSRGRQVWHPGGGEAYLQYLYSPAGQAIAAKHYYRPVAPGHADPADLERFPEVELITIDEVFGGWRQAQSRHFAEGGVFDQIATQ